MRTKTVLILGAGDEQSTAIQLAKETGYKVCVLDSNPNAAGIDYADYFVNCDINSVSQVVNAARKYDVDGIFVHALEKSIIAAKATEILNLPGIKPEVAENTTNKLKRIEIFQKNNIPCPNFGVAETVLEAKKCARDLQYPVVIKPLDNAGSRGVILVKSKNEMEYFFKESFKQCKELKSVLVEEFLVGPQISSETVVYENKKYTTGFNDRNYENFKEYLPYFVEDGGDIPTTFCVAFFPKLLSSLISR